MGLTVTLVLLFVGISGCDSPTPLSAIPTVIYYHADNETRIYVHGEEFMFEGINITIENDSKIENFTYGTTHNTSLSEFRLEIRVLRNDGDLEEPKYKKYTYSADVRLEIDDQKAQFHIIDNHHDDEVKRDSPHKTIMENMK